MSSNFSVLHLCWGVFQEGRRWLKNELAADLESSNIIVVWIFIRKFLKVNCSNKTGFYKQYTFWESTSCCLSVKIRLWELNDISENMEVVLGMGGINRNCVFRNCYALPVALSLTLKFESMFRGSCLMEIVYRSSVGVCESLKKYFVLSTFSLLRYPELKENLIQENFCSLDEVYLQMLNHFICMDLINGCYIAA